VTVAYPKISLFATLYGTDIPCTAAPLASTSLTALFAAGTTFASTRITESFANAFSKRGAGDDNGTRFLIGYSGFPPNAHVYIPDRVAGSSALVPSIGGDLGPLGVVHAVAPCCWCACHTPMPPGPAVIRWLRPRASARRCSIR
jgi:hypothetical protein